MEITDVKGLWCLKDADYRPRLNDLREFYRRKYYRRGEPGWGPQLRMAFEYFTPDDIYELLVDRLLADGHDWADVGCGRDVFPQYPELAASLCDRAGMLFGIDPDSNVLENEFVTASFQGFIEDCDTDYRFDLITMRMVAEHIAEPDASIARAASLLKPGGRMVIYTPNRWSPMSLAAAVVPFSLHNPLKRLLWSSEAQDTFPTEYKLNTHADLSKHTANHGLEEELFAYADDCRLFSRYKLLNRLELATRSLFQKIRLRHPENCIVAVYRKS